MSQSIDFGRTTRDYVRHRPGLPERLYQRLERVGVVLRATPTLDLGTGTGSFALARRGARVTGLDPSLELLRESCALGRTAGKGLLTARFPNEPLAVEHRVYAVTECAPRTR